MCGKRGARKHRSCFRNSGLKGRGLSESNGQERMGSRVSRWDPLRGELELAVWL